jgi:nicotinate-nucleotide pyrophosphorylase (carboxylating)
MNIITKEIQQLVVMALNEDLLTGDVTSRSLIPAGSQAKAILKAKEAGVVCGEELVAEVFRQVEAKLKGQVKIKFLVRDGASVKKNDKVALIEGNTRVILAAERTALNFIQQLSGVATLTRQYVNAIKLAGGLKLKMGWGTHLLDTRKTIPGLRILQKYAVKVGGGTNHRMGLFDAILIKDNHIKAVGGIPRTIRSARIAAKQGKERLLIEVEVKDLEELHQAVAERPDRILLDNFALPELAKAVEICHIGKVKCEASGGITLKNIGQVAKTGVDFISVGALTHSAPALDMSLKIV